MAYGEQYVKELRAEWKTERAAKHDFDTVMVFGKHKGKRLGDIPDFYWKWFVQQEWAPEWPGLFEFANTVLGTDDDIGF